MTAIRVLIDDDDALVRAGLTWMLGELEDIEVATAVGAGAEVLSVVYSHLPEVVLMDIGMPGMDGIATTERLRARREPPEVIILTTFDTDRHIRLAMRAGASGFLLKHTPPQQIARAIRQVAAGEPMLGPEVIRRVMAFAAEPDRDPRQARAREMLDRLSGGERAVAALVGRGHTNQQIGQQLLMSTATVKAYMSRILAKLDLSNRVQLALLVHDADEPPDKPRSQSGA
jgi:DNA-binding NarL/FixJ family response regulator